MINWHKDNFYKKQLEDMIVWTFQNREYAMLSGIHAYYALNDEIINDVLQYRSKDANMRGLLFIFEPIRVK